MANNRFYLACFRDNVGSNVSFQRHEFCGYSTDIDQAHVCTLGEAQKEFNSAREYDLPISADHVEALAVWKVDHQYIPRLSEFKNADDRYVAFLKGAWDGNDVYWIVSDNLDTSLNFELAYVMSLSKAKKLGAQYIVIPFDLADPFKRRTFDFKKLNKRIMVQGAGLKTPEHIKKAKRRSDNPKTRFNCPSCGKISWQFNSREFDGCKDWSCGAFA